MDTKTITPLPKQFEGSGEVRGYTFNQIHASDDGYYIYQVLS